jgi:hypothetical protein
MNREPLRADLVAVSPEELTLVTGGGILSSIWDGIKSAANWVYDHVFVDFGNRIIGYKGTF